MILTASLGYLYTHVLPFILLLGILIFVHELGHFLVARFCGVRVEVFSLGFGKKLLSYKRGDTVYCLSIVPLGGYVKMFGEQGSEAVITEDDKRVSYSHKTPWQRIAIVLAGPLMNFFFAILVFSGIAQVGEQTRAAVIADVAAGSPAEKIGFKMGDRILSVNDVKIRSFEEFQKQLNANKDSSAQAVVADVAGSERTLKLDITSADNPNIFSLEKRLGTIEGIENFTANAAVGVVADSPAHKLGFRTGDEIKLLNNAKVGRWSDLEAEFAQHKDGDVLVSFIRPSVDSRLDAPVTSEQTLTIPAQDLKNFSSLNNFGFESPALYLDQISKDSPAEKADLNRYDKIVSINAVPISKWEDVSKVIKTYDGKDAMTFVVSREGAELTKKITPKVTELTTAFGGIEKRYTVGILPLLSFAEPELTIVKTNSIFESLQKGYQRTYDISVMTVMSFVRLFQGEVSVKNVGGMVSIGKAAKDSFELGAQAFFMTMGILSVSLFILNLMPIPVLDGGHLVFYTIELIKGSPVSLKKIEAAQQVGFVVLLGLMILAQFNDIVRFIFKS